MITQKQAIKIAKLRNTDHEEIEVSAEVQDLLGLYQEYKQQEEHYQRQAWDAEREAERILSKLNQLIDGLEDNDFYIDTD